MAVAAWAGVAVALFFAEGLRRPPDFVTWRWWRDWGQPWRRTADRARCANLGLRALVALAAAAGAAFAGRVGGCRGAARVRGTRWAAPGKCSLAAAGSRIGAAARRRGRRSAAPAGPERPSS